MPVAAVAVAVVVGLGAQSLHRLHPMPRIAVADGQPAVWRLRRPNVPTAMGAAAGSAESPLLDAALTIAPPDPLEVGAGTVLHLEGTCDPAVEAGSLLLAVADRRFASNRDRPL